MAVQDFRHYQAPNGVVDTQAFPLNASETFAAGEPVLLNAQGEVAECADDPSSVLGIAAFKATDVDGASAPAGVPMTVYMASPGQVFITRNFATDGGGTAATPTLTRIGELAGLDFTNGTDWFLDVGQNNLVCLITGVQDAMGNNLSDPRVLPGTGVWVLFTFL